MLFQAAPARWRRPAGLMAALAGLLMVWAGLGEGSLQAQLNVVTYHNDNARTGQNLEETILTPYNVTSDTFGRLFSCALDGWVFAQPLYLSNVSIPGQGTHNVVFIATEHGSVYAFDADKSSGPTGGPLWQTSFIAPSSGIGTIPISDYELPDPPELCITGTPVIDPTSGTLFVVAQTKEFVGPALNYAHRLHALDVHTGAEKAGSPVVIQPTAAGTGDGSLGGVVPFIGFVQLQRPGLLLVKGVVYAAFGSIGDIGNYHGWVVGYDARTLQQVQVFNDTPNGSAGGIWMSGAGLATGLRGNIYLMTGNGTFDVGGQVADLGDSFVKLSPQGANLPVTDYFTPHDQASLESNDGDLGSGGPLVLPDAMGSTNHLHLLIGAGKTGVIYLLDRDQMGHFNPQDDGQIVYSTPPGALPWGMFGMPACYGNWVYFHGPNDMLKAYQIDQAQMSPNPVSQSDITYGYPGATPSISANGPTNGIVWEVATDGYANNSPAILHAYDATDLGHELYNSSQAGTRDRLGIARRFTVPTIVNGKVYVTSGQELDVFGLIGAPVITAQPVSQMAASLATVTLSVTAQGPAPLDYQWQSNGTNIPGATNATLVLSRLVPDQAGQYQVTVRNAAGSTVSAPANVAIMGLSFNAVLTLYGPVGSTYRIDYATALAATNWVGLTNLVLEVSPTLFIDSQSSASGQRFYRATLLSSP